MAKCSARNAAEDNTPLHLARLRAAFVLLVIFQPRLAPLLASRVRLVNMRLVPARLYVPTALLAPILLREAPPAVKSARLAATALPLAARAAQAAKQVKYRKQAPPHVPFAHQVNTPMLIKRPA